jgi:hypothetical protein
VTSFSKNKDNLLQRCLPVRGHVGYVELCSTLFYIKSSSFLWLVFTVTRYFALSTYVVSAVNTKTFTSRTNEWPTDTSHTRTQKYDAEWHWACDPVLIATIGYMATSCGSHGNYRETLQPQLRYVNQLRILISGSLFKWENMGLRRDQSLVHTNQCPQRVNFSYH